MKTLGKPSMNTPFINEYLFNSSQLLGMMENDIFLVDMHTFYLASHACQMCFGREGSSFASGYECLKIPFDLPNNLQNVNFESGDVMGFMPF